LPASSISGLIPNNFEIESDTIHNFPKGLDDIRTEPQNEDVNIEKIVSIVLDRIKPLLNETYKTNIDKNLKETDEEKIFLTEKEVSKMARIAISTLRNHRSKHVGIPYIKNGRSVRYDLKDVLQYMQDRRIKTK
jgi:hypothetical protein